ncbi:TcpQ domain-containing protein [Bilophila wadsworthia]|uniref:TcpQ domain-containing protein n=1 Tax=Bilophila wadsworthia TaxID=35833 RepID=UPI001D0A7FFD|nr:TcpQ domain-containing protein [Bilophila wadsworthia]MCB8572394.1 TcpQ domain-containing protein [Bilophila wadsworthia]
MKRLFVLAVLLISLSGCALRGVYEVAGVRTADALSETYPADAERFAAQAALELSRRYPAGQTGLSLVTVPGMFGSALEGNLRSYGFAILPAESVSGVKVGYLIDEVAGELMPTGYLQIATSDGTSFSMVRKLLGGLPSASAQQAPAMPTPVSAPEEPVPGTPVVQPETRSPAAPAVAQTTLHEPTASAPQKTDAPTPSSSPKGSHASDGKMMPIITAVRTVIPVGWQYRVEGTELRQTHVTYPRNVAWRIALTDIATATDSSVTIDGNAKLVSFTPKGMQPVPATAQPPVVAPVTPESPAVTSALNDAAAQTKSAAAAPETPPADAPKIEATPVPATSPAVTIVAEPMLPEWLLTPGSLHVQLEGWAGRAGYQLVWNADTDLDMQSRASFRGNFVAAITQLFEGLHAAGFPLRATLYPANNVLEVSDR